MEEIDIRKSKARRTHKHTHRIHNKRKKYFAAENMSDSHLGIILETPAVCSCSACGNQRKYVGISKQEKRHYSNFQDFVKEFC
jgi:hypothetical protein